MKIDPRYKEDFFRFWKHLPLQSADETLIVLKGHLLVEELLHSFCESAVPNPQFLHKSSFPQTVALARALDAGVKVPDWAWGAVGMLNELRNMLAHKLEAVRYAGRRDEFLAHVRSHHPMDEIADTFPEAHGQLAVAIFCTFLVMSAHLRHKSLATALGLT